MPALQDPEFVRALRLQMLQFAVGRLGDAHLAEDVVQEALMGAFINADQYSERAALRTWVFGILKHKIADTQRAQQRFSYAKPLNDTNLSEAPPEWLEERLPASAQTQNPIAQVEAPPAAPAATPSSADLPGTPTVASTPTASVPSSEPTPGTN